MGMGITQRRESCVPTHIRAKNITGNMDNKQPTVYDFPPTKETNNLKIWHHLNIDQKAKLTIGTNEQIHESIIYQFKDEPDLLKILSKINTSTKQLTYVINSKNIITKPTTATLKQYQDLIQDLEQQLSPILNLNSKQTLKGIQIENELSTLTK